MCNHIFVVACFCLAECVQRSPSCWYQPYTVTLKITPVSFTTPMLKGSRSNVFFLDHDKPEDTPDESRSKRNTHEAKFLASLYLYLRLQGYSEKDITVLALYKDQVLLLRSLIKQVKSFFFFFFFFSLCLSADESQ